MSGDHAVARRAGRTTPADELPAVGQVPGNFARRAASLLAVELNTGALQRHPSPSKRHRFIPEYRWRQAAATPGSYCVPLSRAISPRASATLAAGRYARGDVIASSTSATMMIRAPRPISSPLSPNG